MYAQNVRSLVIFMRPNVFTDRDMQRMANTTPSKDLPSDLAEDIDRIAQKQITMIQMMRQQKREQYCKVYGFVRGIGHRETLKENRLQMEASAINAIKNIKMWENKMLIEVFRFITGSTEILVDRAIDQIYSKDQRV